MVKANVVSAKKIESVSLSAIPDGSYLGVWGGYEVEVMIDGIKYELRTDNGVRTMNASCTVKVSGGAVTIN